MTIAIVRQSGERGYAIRPVLEVRGAKHGSRREDDRKEGFYERPGENAKMRNVRR